MTLKLNARIKEFRRKFIIKQKRFPVHWSSKILFKYKRNAIAGELHRAKKITSDFDQETKKLKTKYIDAENPKHVIENTINNFVTERKMSF